MNEKAVRRPELGDPIVDRRGKIVGIVTSCAIDMDGYLSGLANVLESNSEVGSQLALYQTGGGKRKLRAAESFKLGSKLPVPDLLTVQSRFPKRVKKIQ
jgi:glycine hydroxymethyltransferase